MQNINSSSDADFFLIPDVRFWTFAYGYTVYVYQNKQTVCDKIIEEKYKNKPTFLGSNLFVNRSLPPIIIAHVRLPRIPNKVIPKRISANRHRTGVSSIPAGGTYTQLFPLILKFLNCSQLEFRHVHNFHSILKDINPLENSPYRGKCHKIVMICPSFGP